MNDDVWVNLTDYGKEIWNKVWTDIGLYNGVPPSIRIGATEVNGRTRFQLWDLMHTFGPCMFMGNRRMPFVDNSIYFSKDGN